MGQVPENPLQRHVQHGVRGLRHGHFVDRVAALPLDGTPEADVGPPEPPPEVRFVEQDVRVATRPWRDRIFRLPQRGDVLQRPARPRRNLDDSNPSASHVFAPMGADGVG